MFVGTDYLISLPPCVSFFVKSHFACSQNKDYYRKSSECEVNGTCNVAGK